MSVTIENITERQLRIGIIKVAVALGGCLFLVASIVTLIVDGGGMPARIAVNGLLLAAAFMFIANGLLAILHIIDWFKKRRVLKEDKNG